MLKKPRGRPRLWDSSHGYSVKQWVQHQSAFNKNPDELRALKFLKKFGLALLLTYSFPDLLKSVHGKKPKCFALGNIDTLPGCQKCIEGDFTSEVEGFFNLEGKELGPDAYGVYCSCWIIHWVRRIGGTIGLA